MDQYTVGIDFGSLSGRAVLMNAVSGEILTSAVYEYPHAVMSDTLLGEIRLSSHTALQHPADYLEVLQNTVPKVCQQAGIDPFQVIGIGFDFTACTMLPIDEKGMPLCFQEKYQKEPHAYVKLWKDHSAQAEADHINAVAQERREDWLKIYGGKISSEWMIPKILKILREAPYVYEETARFAEAADWIYRVLTGMERYSAPFAGYKALWNETNGYPSAEFFEAVDLRLASLVGTKLASQVTPIHSVDGRLSENGANLTGLREGIAVSIPILDAHASMPTLGVTEEGTLMMILGTSGCHIVNAKNKIEISGICGYVKDGVIPEMYTYEAGQACCGDHFAWFVERAMPASYAEEAKRLGVGAHKYLREKAQTLRPGESGLLALDWFNGNRSVLSDGDLNGMILGMTLNTKPEEIYRALIEATAYGTRIIVENFEKAGIRIDRIVASGGIAEKDPMLMQIYADVLNRPITVSDAKFSAACGSAMYAATAAGIYADIRAASKQLSVSTGREYRPIHDHVPIYDCLYGEYKILHDYFGRGENPVMKRLAELRKGANA